MSERIKALHELRQKCLTEARSLLDSVQTAGRAELNPDEEAQYTRAMEDWNRYDAAIKREEEVEAREAAGTEERKAFIAPTPEPQEPSIEERLLAAVQSKAPVQFSIERRTDYPLTSGEASTTYSSYAVTSGAVAPMIEELKYAYSAVLQAGCNQITTDSIATMYVPKVTTNPTINAAGAASSFENTAPTNSSYPVLGRTTLDGYRLDAFAVISEEDIASSTVDMMAFLNRTLAGALAAKVAYMLIIGSGSNAPKGLQIAATTGVTTAATTSFTGDEVIQAYQSVSAQYWPGLRAVISQLGCSALSQLKDGNQNYLWRQGLSSGNPDSIQGVPLYVDPQGQAVTAGLKPLVFYNPTNFHVRWCMGGRVFYDVSTEAQFTQFNRVIRIAQWLDCDAGDSGGCKSLTMHS